MQKRAIHRWAAASLASLKKSSADRFWLLRKKKG
jgi:hypothetical protein